MSSSAQRAACYAGLPDPVTEQVAAIRAALAELEARRQQGVTPDKVPMYTVTITHLHQVFAGSAARTAAEHIAQWGRKTGVQLVLDPHDRKLPISLSDFGGSDLLRSRAFNSVTTVPVPAGERMTLGAKG